MPYRQAVTTERSWLSGRVLWPVAAVVIGVILLVVTIKVTGRKDATDLEKGLLEFIFFAVGAGFSFLAGRLSVATAAKEMVRRDGRKAIRHLVTLGRGIQSFQTTIAEASTLFSSTGAASSGVVPVGQVRQTFAILESQIEGQVRTVVDAIEDWRDIVPEELNELDVQAQEASEAMDTSDHV